MAENLDKPHPTKPIVTPWHVQGNIDYDRLIKEFGTEKIDDKLLQRIKKITGGDELHYMLRRKIFFSHKYLNEALTAYETGEKIYLYTGRAPSGPVHLGHLVPWIFTKWLQDQFKAPLLFQIPDEEKVFFKKGLTFDESKKWAYDNILDIIALGFDPKKTKIFLDTEYAKTMYKTACKVAGKVTFSTAKSVFGFKNSDNLGAIFYTCMQSVPAFLPTEFEGKPTQCIIPHAIDQDPHFRVTRDVAPQLGYPKPCSVHCRFLPGLQGMHAEGKMSASIESTAVYTCDDEKTVKNKINKYAFSGGKATIEEHRRDGGNPDIDVSYQWLVFFEEDDAKLKKIYDDYKSGALLTGELKQILIDKLNTFLVKHREKREKVKDQVEKFMVRD
ncbi:TPA: tryptophan--tRNA ligase [Candidatus Woesearchaeota archaeon]|nr:tryptophan--tRNA ligase [Candidatus Woesearchaeota archaeon]